MRTKAGAKIFIPLLLLFGLCIVMAGCRSSRTAELRRDIPYIVSFSNNVIAKIERSDTGLELLFLHGDKPIAEVWSDGEMIRTVQKLNLGARAADSPHSSEISVATINGKLIRHAFQWFDGKSWQMLADTNLDFFPDYRISVEVDKNDKPIPGTRKREAIEYKFTPKGTNAQTDLK